DTLAGLTTLVIVALFLTGQLHVWQILLLKGISSVLNVFQNTAYSAAVTMLVPKDDLGRANGRIQLSIAIAQIFAPALAAVLGATMRIVGVLIIDVVSSVFAVAATMSVHIPQPEGHHESAKRQASVLQDLAYGWSYITAHPGLMGLLIFLGAINFLLGVVFVL